MNLRYRKISFFLCLLLISCHQTTVSENEQYINKVLGTQIKLPKERDVEIKSITNHINNGCELNHKNKKKIICYLSNECNICIEELIYWKSIIEECEKYHVDISFYIKIKDWDHINRLLKAWNFTHPIKIDSNGEFEKLNSYVYDPSFNTFLVDENNKIILFGNPVKSERIKVMFYEFIKNPNPDVRQLKIKLEKL